jgi:hypothetical protein
MHVATSLPEHYWWWEGDFTEAWKEGKKTVKGKRSEKVETDRGYTNYSPSKTQHNTEPHLLIFSKNKSGALSETPTVYHSFLSTTYDTRHKAVISILFHALQLKSGDVFFPPSLLFLSFTSYCITAQIYSLLSLSLSRWRTCRGCLEPYKRESWPPQPSNNKNPRFFHFPSTLFCCLTFLFALVNATRRVVFRVGTH